MPTLPTTKQVLEAGVGATDLAVGVVRDYAAGAQKKASDVRQSLVEFDPVAFGTQTVRSLNDQVAAVPARVQQVVETNVNAATDAYGDLVERGRTLVGRIRRQQSTQEAVKAAETTVRKAKATRHQATDAVDEAATAAKKGARSATRATKKATAPKRSAAKSSAKATRTSAKKTVSAGSRALADAAKKVGD